MQTEKTKITFVIPSLAAGGAERILSFIAQNINKELFDTTLLVIGFKKDNVYNVSNLNVVYFNKPRVISAIPQLFSYFRVHKPNIVVSSIVHLNTVIALLSVFFPKIKFVAREANVLSVLVKYNNYSKVYFPKQLIVFAYRRLIDKLVCQSKDMQEDMIQNYRVPEKKTILINNPITSTYICKTTTRDTTEPLKLITIARLSKEKGHDRVIKALAKLKVPFHYTIIGDGIEKENIQNLIESYRLTEHITFITFTNEVEKYLTKSDLFLQGSYSEGFPNALIESCMVGTPIIAFDAPGGLNEIIENGINGVIVNDDNEFIEQIQKQFNSFSFISEEVSHAVRSRFDKEKIVAQYEALFLSLMD